MKTVIRKICLILSSSILSVTFVLGTNATYLLPEKALAEDNDLANVSFTDVGEEDTYYLPITELAKEGIINGYEDGTFKPYETINRAEALKILLEAFSEIPIEDYEDLEEDPFTDVTANNWYTKYISAAKAQEITNGYEDNTFKPWESVNLAETLKFLVKARNAKILYTPDEQPFADIPLDAWYIEYVQYASDREAININGNNEIFPSQEMSRGYFASVIYKIIEFGQGSHFGKATFYGAAVQGHGTASGETFDMYAMTAAHKTLPFDTIVEVTNLANGKKIQVRITDRGPYGPGRVIDLTSSAFAEISELHRGIINVEYKVVEPNVDPAVDPAQ